MGRDHAKNMYRTSYSDMSHFREVAIRSDFPSGYGGHIPSLRHDVLFRNTAFDREIIMRKNDPSRDVHPTFEHQITGIPSCKNPRGSKSAPSYKVVPHDGTTTEPKPPYGRLMNRTRTPLNHRHTPPTMRRTMSTPQMAGAALMGSSRGMDEPTNLVETTNFPPTPGTRLQNTVARANEEARQGSFPSETDMLYEQ